MQQHTEPVDPQVRIAELEAALRQSQLEIQRAVARQEDIQGKLSQAMESAQLAWWEWNISSDQLTVHPYKGCLLGYTDPCPVISGKDWMNEVHPDDLPRVFSSLQECIKNQTNLWICEHRFKNLEGNWRWVENKGSVTRRADDGTAVCMIGTTRDIDTSHRTQEQLKLNEENFRQTFDSASIGMVICDLKGGFTQVNAAFCEIVGYSKEELLQLNFLAITHPDDQMTNKTDVEHLLAGQAVSFQREKRYLRKNGQPVWARVVVTLLRDLNEAPIKLIAQIENIHEARQAREILERDAEILARIPDAIIVMDADGKITYWNKAAEVLLGWKADEIIGHSILDRLPSSVPESVMEYAKRSLEKILQGEDFYKEVLDYRKDGSRIWTRNHYHRIIDQHGCIIGVIGIKTDNTARKTAEAEIHRLFAAIEQCPIAVEITDPDGTITYVNPAFCKNSGYSSGEVVGCNLNIIKSDQTPESVYEELRTTVASGKTWTGEIISKRKDGSYYTENTIITPITDDEGKITNYLGIKEDITAIKQERDQYKRLEAELRQAQKMETIGTLAGGIAHDFNNILTAIFGYGELAQRHIDKTNPAYNDIEKVLVSARRARELTRQILTFSRREELKIFPIRFTPILNEAVSLLRATTPSWITIKTIVKTTHDAVLGDSTQLQQVLINLGTNAVHAMRNHGKLLEFEVNRVHLGGKSDIRLSKLPHGYYLRIQVRDEGTGMAPELLKRIFDPFFTTKPEGEGTGLGLPVVLGIVLSHSGQILVDSVEGVGTTFQIYLPSTILPETKDHQQALTTVGGVEHILLVEDEIPILQAQTTLLTKLGYHVTPCSTGTQAAIEFANNSIRYQLVITDQNMPGITGIDLARKIRVIHKSIPIIITSGYSQSLTAEIKNELNIAAFVDKPFNASRLDHAIRQACEAFGNKQAT